MKPITLTLAVTALFVATSVSAQIYQWKDENGKMIYSDQPPIGIPHQHLQKANTPPPAASSATQKTVADRDMDFRKRQKDSQESAEKAKKEQSASAEKQQYCDNTRRRLQALESGERISMHDDKGERYYMDDAQREKEIAKARQDISSNCN